MSSTTSNQITIKSPLKGFVLPLESVPDDVFAKKMVGDGVAIEPIDNTLLAPVAGLVSMIHTSGHAITIKSNSGYEVLMHIGLETVNLKGEGFDVLVKQGDEVKIGDKLIQFDMDLLAQKAKSLVTPVLLINSEEKLKFGSIDQVDFQDELFSFKTNASKSLESDSSQLEKISSKEYLITNSTGIHARPSAVIASEAKKFSSKIMMVKAGSEVNAKSIVGIMGLEVKENESIIFEATGVDGKEALNALDKIMNFGFDEHEESPSEKVEVNKTLAQENENTFAGIPASPGLSVGKIFQISNEEILVEDVKSEPKKEKDTFEKALNQAKVDLDDLRTSLIAEGNPGRAAIFNAHLELIDDPDLIEETISLIQQKKSAAFAWKSAYLNHAKRLSELTNELFAARAADLKDVGNRVLRILVGDAKQLTIHFPDEAILIAESLTPSDTASLDKNKVLGFATTTGGATSHVAILARSLGIPAITGINLKALDLKDETPVVLDGDAGTLKINISDSELNDIRKKQKELEAQKEKALQTTFEPAVLKDGTLIEVAANIAGVNEAKDSMKFGCDGVGLLRSEFLFLERSSAPTENDQLLTYQNIADSLKVEDGEDKKFIVRTLDVGGDKPLSYMPIPQEENPFLGERGIRVSLNNKEVFREQIRAILRVKPLKQVRIMFPMVSSFTEIKQAKEIVEQEKRRLNLEDQVVEIGIMIEVPSAAIMVEQFAEYVDFFSVGANDLTQYTLAIDRGHNKLAKLADGLDPAVLRLIKMTCDGAAKHQKWVGVCGGIASELPAVPLLIGLGVRELSVSIPVLPAVKAEVRKYSLTECEDLASKAIHEYSAKAVRDLVKNYKG